MKCYEVVCNDIISSKDLFKQQVLVPGYVISYLDAASVVVPAEQECTELYSLMF
jgi:hypothetical protein